MSNPLRDRAVFVGVGHTPSSRNMGISPMRFTLDACTQARADAGIDQSEIDGIVTVGTLSELEVLQHLGLEGVTYHAGPLGGGVGGGVAANAALAVASGLCEVALGVVTMEAPKPGVTYNYMGGNGARGDDAFTLPYGDGVFMQHFAPYYQRRRLLDGVTDEQMGAYVVAMRDNAMRNPNAVWHEAITMDDYRASRYVAEPLRLLDCDMPVDVCGAVIVTTPERAKDLKQQPVFASAMTTGQRPRPSAVFWHDYDEMPYKWAAKRLWSNAGVGPQDMDFAMLYDGFSPLVLYCLQDFGFVSKGAAGEFLGAGEHLRGGSLPLNPHGGNNSEGRSWGFGHVCEAILQLQGRSGERQLPDVHATMIGGGGIVNSSALVLHN